jgi:L-asparaginase
MGWIAPSIGETLTENYMLLSNVKRLEVVGEMSMI